MHRENAFFRAAIDVDLGLEGMGKEAVPLMAQIDGRMLTVNNVGTSWLFTCAVFDLLSMLMMGLVSAITVHSHHIKDDAVVSHAVDRHHRGHRVFARAGREIESYKLYNNKSQAKEL
jgi:hypothetical protein